jgi:hypothetical protein
MVGQTFNEIYCFNFEGQRVTEFSDLERKAIICIDFINTNKKHFNFSIFHRQDCSENVYLEDIEGSLEGLKNTPILGAEIVSSESISPEKKKTKLKPYCYGDSETWTFYRLFTAKGSVWLRFYGSSNGYYSESVSVGISPSCFSIKEKK